jgi:predicted pyridoxine 5'-phosphate oxidase superfamily flavin-nucleotide-binding protein
MYHTGNRELQDHFGSRALADRLLERTHHVTLTEDDKAFIESRPFFFLATATPGGAPDCSFKGGAPGFVSVPEPDLLVFPDYDGNGMFKSLGNIRDNPQVGLLFIDLSDRPRRLRVNGHASVVLDDPLLDRFAGAQALVRVRPQHVFPNCPRYIPDLPGGYPSAYVPTAGEPPLEPKWKAFDDFQDVVPPRHPRADPSRQSR